jgi:hypothetical protein
LVSLDENPELAEHAFMKKARAGIEKKTKVDVRLLGPEEAAQEDRAYWHSKTPAERLAAAEQLRQAAYGYDPAASTSRIASNGVSRPK